jgi:secreted PhoX family phosphatase
VTIRHLPLVTAGAEGPHGNRSHMTCRYKCGNACDQPVPNTSTNEHVQDVIRSALARRSVLKAGGGALALGAVSSFAPAPAAAKGSGTPAGRNLGTTRFSPVPPNTYDAVTTADGFTSEVVIRWGDPVVPGAPEFDAHAQTPESAAAQFGYNNDYVGVLPLAGRRHLLVTNHEYTNEELMFPAGRYNDDVMRRVAIQSHGLSVVEIERGARPGRYTVRPVAQARYNRRITGTTPFVLDGPAAGDPRMRTTADPTGR